MDREYIAVLQFVARFLTYTVKHTFMKNSILRSVIAIVVVVIVASGCFVSRDGRHHHEPHHDEVIIKGRVN